MSGKGTMYRNLVLISQISINVMVPTFICLAIGIWLDHRFNTWFTIPLLILGIAAGARNAYVLAMNTIRREEYSRKKQLEDDIARKVAEAKKKNNRQD